MFDMGFLELMMIAIVSLIVMGPEKLPGAIRTVMALIHKIRSTAEGLRYELEREIGAEELRQELKNNDIAKSIDEARSAIEDDLDHLQQNADHIQQELNSLNANQQNHQ